jgi:hypothetical protein
MEGFFKTFHYDYDGTSLTMFLFYILKKLDVVAKRYFVSKFLEVMNRSERSPFDPATIHTNIRSYIPTFQK